MNVGLKKKVLFVTGTRADYSKQRELIEIAVAKHEIEVHVLCTGMHLLPDFGHTHNELSELESSGVVLHKIANNCEVSMSQSYKSTVAIADSIIREYQFEALILHGDRLEPLACATIAMIHGVKIIHIEGGEISGTIDEVIRHSISKMANYHLVANENAKNRLKRMGEEPDSIFLFGSLDIHTMLHTELPEIESVCDRYDLPNRNFSIVLMHGVVTNPEDSHLFASHIREVVEARDQDFFLVIAPNSDSGSSQIYEEFRNIDTKNYKLIPSMRFDHYLTALYHCDVLIGNSSSGIREAPVYGIPVINLGSRQKGRAEINYPGCINIAEPDAHQLFRHATKFFGRKMRFDPVNEFGRFDSLAVFSDVLELAMVDNRSTQKYFYDETF